MEDKNSGRIIVFSDAGFPNVGESKKVAEEVCVYGISYGVRKNSMYYVVRWMSRQQRRESHSNGQAETIASGPALGFTLNVQTVWKYTTGKTLPITVVLDNLGLYRWLVTQSKPTHEEMVGYVHALRLDYESEVFDDIFWVSGKLNPADCLTKPLIGGTWRLMNYLLNDRRLPVDLNISSSRTTQKVEEMWTIIAVTANWGRCFVDTGWGTIEFVPEWIEITPYGRRVGNRFLETWIWKQKMKGISCMTWLLITGT